MQTLLLRKIHIHSRLISVVVPILSFLYTQYLNLRTVLLGVHLVYIRLFRYVKNTEALKTSMKLPPVCQICCRCILI